MKQLIEIIARELVDEPNVVSITEVGGMYTSILELRVAKSDIGKIIGKNGRTVSALRTIISAVSAKGKKRTVLEILE
ncbi:MAG: KH domain-containing protein [Thermodesulfobacteriota bacterium]